MATRTKYSMEVGKGKSKKVPGATKGYIKVKGGIKSKKTGKVYKQTIAQRKKSVRAGYASGKYKG